MQKLQFSFFPFVNLAKEQRVAFPLVSATKKDAHRRPFLWQRMRDSNPRKRSQSPVCYRYTNPLFTNQMYYTPFFWIVNIETQYMSMCTIFSNIYQAIAIMQTNMV